MNPLVDHVVQCWGCPVFDKLINVVSGAAAAAYGKFATLCVVLFCGLLAFYIINAVWKNIKDGVKDPFYKKSVQPVLISALVALTLLAMGVVVPRVVTSITFEPVAEITLRYTQVVSGMTDDAVDARVDYTPMPMGDDGFYRPQLRDRIIMLMKTTVTQFQAYVKLGLAVMDAAFSWGALGGIGAFIKHVMMFFIGLYLVYGFFKLFVRYCFYFADIIVAMTYFAFFFPLSLALFAFRQSDAPDWMKNYGKKMGTDQIKKVINAIVALGAAVLTYSVAMVLIAKFFGGADAGGVDLMGKITSGTVLASDLSDENLAGVTLMGAVVLVYVVNFLISMVPDVTKMVLGAFDVGTETKISEGLANDAGQLTKTLVGATKQLGQTILGDAGADAKKSGDATQKKDTSKDGGAQ